jgi:hypothetical protein
MNKRDTETIRKEEKSRIIPTKKDKNDKKKKELKRW